MSTIPTSPLDLPLAAEVATLKDTVSNIVYSFPFNINSLDWNYQLNTQSYDTIGGRVTQLLSVRFSTMVVQGEAGSRGNLTNLYEDFKTIQDNQNSYKVSMIFSVPSSNLSFKVYLESFQIGWDPTTVTYPYIMYFEVDQDLTKVATQAATMKALNDYAITSTQGIGFSEAWTGLGTANTQNLQYNSIAQALANIGSSDPVSLFTNN